VQLQSKHLSNKAGRNSARLYARDAEPRGKRRSEGSRGKCHTDKGMIWFRPFPKNASSENAPKPLIAGFAAYILEMLKGFFRSEQQLLFRPALNIVLSMDDAVDSINIVVARSINPPMCSIDREAWQLLVLHKLAWNQGVAL